MEEVYAKAHILDEFVAHLTDGSNLFLSLIIQEVEIALIQSLEGCRDNWVYLLTEPQDHFYRYQKGEIDREEIVRQIKYVVYLGLRAEYHLYNDKHD